MTLPQTAGRHRRAERRDAQAPRSRDRRPGLQLHGERGSFVAGGGGGARRDPRAAAAPRPIRGCSSGPTRCFHNIGVAQIGTHGPATETAASPTTPRGHRRSGSHGVSSDDRTGATHGAAPCRRRPTTGTGAVQRHRLHTAAQHAGGPAPATGCDATTIATETRIPLFRRLFCVHRAGRHGDAEPDALMSGPAVPASADLLAGSCGGRTPAPATPISIGQSRASD